MNSNTGIVESMKTAVKRTMYYANYAAGRYRNPIWVVGDGRSGTTWVANLINYHARYRFIFEPFHHSKVSSMSDFRPYQYLRVGDRGAYHLERARAVFSGRFQNAWADRYADGLFFDGLLVKDIFAHLFLEWADELFPDVRKVFVLRHPCAVAASKRALSTWVWTEDPQVLWEQPELREDHLLPFEDLIRKTQDPLLKSVLVGSIVNYIPMTQLSRSRLHLVFYENLCVNPADELARLFRYLGDGPENPWDDEKLRALYSKPSRTSRDDSAVVVGEDRISAWKKTITSEDVDRVLEVTAAFGLDKVYGRDPLPNREAAESMMRA